jgi:hypothetical protein
MKQIISLLMVLAILSSCKSGSKNIAHLKPETTTISGDLSEYLQLVDGDYEITDDWGGRLSIKVKALKPLDETLIKDKDISLIASLLNESGSPVSGSGEFKLDFSSHEKFMSLLKRGSGEEVILLSSGLGNYHAEEHADKSKKFILSSTITDAPVASTTADNTTSSDLSEEGSSDYDEMLDSYEKYTDDYIKMLNSMSKDDMGAAMNDYANLLESSQEFEQKLKAAESKLSSKQSTRMLRIQSKMITAMQKIDATK